MNALFSAIGQTLLSTVRDVLPIAVVLALFQLLVLRKPIPHLRRVLVGGLFVLFGLALFLIGLDGALFPLGESMARQLSDPQFVFGTNQAPADPRWSAYLWVYAFALLLGFTTTVAEPALIAVAIEAENVSRGTIRQGAALDDGHWLPGRDRPDRIRPAILHPAGLRLRRRHHLDRDRATGRGSWPRPGRHHSWP
jgi:hypothetical protein